MHRYIGFSFDSLKRVFQARVEEKNRWQVPARSPKSFVCVAGWVYVLMCVSLRVGNPYAELRQETSPNIRGVISFQRGKEARVKSETYLGYLFDRRRRR